MRGSRPFAPFVFSVLLVIASGSLSAQSLKKVDVSPKTVVGGQSVQVTVFLTKTGTATPKIRSSDVSVLDIPEQDFQIYNKSWQNRTFWTKPVSSNRTVTITASHSGLQTTVNLVVTPPPAGPTTQTHTIRKSDMPTLLKLAKASGFHFFSGRRGINTQDCRIEASPTLGLVLRIDTPLSFPVSKIFNKCEYKLFWNAWLKNGFTVSPGGISWETAPGEDSLLLSWGYKLAPGSAADMKMTIEIISREAGQQRYLRLTSIRLKGPSNLNWKDAFQD